MSDYKEELKLRVDILKDEIESGDLRPEDVKRNKVLIKHFKQQIKDL